MIFANAPTRTTAAPNEITTLTILFVLGEIEFDILLFLFD
jgi:hypothetical protein